MNCGTRLRVEVHNCQHTNSVGDHLIGDRGHVVLVALGVLDQALDTSSVTRCLNQRTVERFPASRRSRVGQDESGLEATCTLVAATLANAVLCAEVFDAGAHIRFADETVIDRNMNIADEDRLHCGLDVRDVGLLVVDRGVSRNRGASEQLNSCGDGAFGFLHDRLVNSHALSALQDCPQTINSCVLTRGRNGETSVGQHLLCSKRETIVSNQHTVDIATSSSQQLLKDDAALCVVPVRNGFFTDGLETGIGDRSLVALLEQRCVVVSRRAMELDDLLALGVATEALDQAFTLGCTHSDVVERHVHVGRATKCEAVVVDVLDTGCSSLLLDGRTRLRVEVDNCQHTNAVGDHLIGDRGHVVLVAFGVLDQTLDTCGITGGLNQRTVECFPPSR